MQKLQHLSVVDQKHNHLFPLIHSLKQKLISVQKTTLYQKTLNSDVFEDINEPQQPKTHNKKNHNTTLLT